MPLVKNQTSLDILFIFKYILSLIIYNLRRMMQPIYLDHNATTPIDPEVAEAMIPYLKEHFGNPSSSHWFGMQTKKAVENARRQLASLLDCQPDEIIFTSGGTESNNFAIRGVAETFKHKGNHIITSQVEHPAVINVCKFLEQNGYTVTYISVDSYGMVDPKEIEKAIHPETILITIMHANNETGVLQPIEEAAEIAHESGALFHTDAVQSAGKIPINVREMDIDMLSMSGHKINALKGVGALYVKKNIRMSPLTFGGSHERGLRPGTENVAGIVGFAKALELIVSERNNEFEKLKASFTNKLSIGTTVLNKLRNK